MAKPDNVKTLVKDGMPLGTLEGEGGPQVGRNKLSIIASARLVHYIEAEYAKLRLDDGAFAKAASQAIGFPVLESHVETRRRELGIMSTREQKKMDEKATLVQRVERLEALLNMMQAKLADLLK